MTEERVVLLQDVAARAGVSPATASRVLGQGSGRRVGEELRRRVERAAQELGYTANSHARALSRTSSDLVGLVVHDVADPYFATVATGVMKVAADRGLLVLMASTFRDPEREIEFVTALRGQRVRAIVLAGSRVTSRDLNDRLRLEVGRFQAAGGRVAVIGQDLLGTDAVLPDNRGGAKALAEALLGLGHRRFAVLGGERALVTARERVAGFLGPIKAAGLSAEVVYSSFDRDGGRAATERLAASGDLPTCLFAVNDVMAIGAVAALRELGVAVPGRVSVAGFDDIEAVRDQVPALTTVRLPQRYMGERVLELALSDAAGRQPTLLTVPGEVVLRASTAAP
ncbi:LacI family DNA-binding transcriptional regulator [Spirillospora sp. CA-294931]|uniref:LacI family DNA-binding transcriptional regulator n=1 Tax=Spirillospora sp. CA-294931 TaxID=3240042 RepID=UPI003D8F4566